MAARVCVRQRWARFLEASAPLSLARCTDPLYEPYRSITHGLIALRVHTPSKGCVPSISARIMDEHAPRPSHHQRVAFEAAIQDTRDAFTALLDAMHTHAPILAQANLDIVERNMEQGTMWSLSMMGKTNPSLRIEDMPTLLAAITSSANRTQAGDGVFLATGMSKAKLRIRAACLEDAARLWQALNRIVPTPDSLRSLKALPNPYQP